MKPWERYAAQEAAQKAAEDPQIQTAAKPGPWTKYAASRPSSEQTPPAAAQERGLGHRIYDNLVGDSTDGVQSTGEVLGTWLNRAGESATLGIVGDEASAAATGMLPGRTYKGELERYRQNEKDMSTLGQLSADLTGALVPGAGMVGGVAKAATLGQAARRAAGIGAAAGAINGFAEGEGGISDRMADAAINAPVGAAIGAAIPVAARAAGQAARGVKSAVANRASTRELAKEVGVGRKSAKLLRDIAEMDDATSMAAALEREGAMLADAGPTTQGALDAAIQSPGKGAKEAMRRIDERAAEAGRRVTGELDRTLGRPGASASREIAVYSPKIAKEAEAVPREADGWVKFRGLDAAKTDIRRSTAGARRSGYEAAYARPIDYAGDTGRALEGLQSRLPGKAVAYANQLMRLRGEKSAQILAKVADDGTVSFEKLPDVRQWDYIKQALDQMAESGDGAGALGGQTRLGAAFQSLSREVRDHLADAVPEYRTALDTASDAIGRVQGVDFGAKLLSAKVTREEAAAKLGGLTKPQLAAVRQGVRAHIDDTLANVRAVATDPNVDARQAYKAVTDMSSPSARAKMKLLVGKDWETLERALEDAATALGMRARVATNSRTFGRQQFGQMIDDVTEAGALGKGNWINGLSTATAPAKGLLQVLTGATPARVQKARALIRSEVADVLTRPKARSLLAALEKAGEKSKVPADAGKLLEGVVAVELLGTSGQTAQGISDRLPKSRRLPHTTQ